MKPESAPSHAEALGGGKPDAPLTTAERQVLAPLRRQEPTQQMGKNTPVRRSVQET